MIRVCSVIGDRYQLFGVIVAEAAVGGGRHTIPFAPEPILYDMGTSFRFERNGLQGEVRKVVSLPLVVPALFTPVAQK